MRFNLKFLLLLSTLVALLFAALFGLPSFIAGALTFCLLGLIPAALACGVHFGSNGKRAFCLGALIPILPNTLFCYFIASPSIIVADEINWWRTQDAPVPAGDAFLLMYQGWAHTGWALLAMQVPVWVTAILCGVCAMAARRWFVQQD